MTTEKRRIPEKIKALLGGEKQFIHGNQAVVYGAMMAGCDFYAGYPITPSTEIAEGMSRMLPRIGGVYVQMEDEISSLAAVIGASLAGKRAFTATSGPGFSLMQENIGYACMVEAPCVIVDVQRSGPSTGQPTMPAQGDVMQSRWGTHGDHEVIVLSPSSVQEAMHLMVHAFNLSDKYRVPVICLGDGFLMHMRERVSLPSQVEHVETERMLSSGSAQDFGVTRPGKVPALNPLGSCKPGDYLTGLTHDSTGMPVTSVCEVHEHLIKRQRDKIKGSLDDILMVEEQYTEDAEVAVISYGISARPALSAVISARQEGYKAGFMSVKTLFPRPGKEIFELSRKVDRLIVVEMNLGQYYLVTKSAAAGDCRVELVSTVGGRLPDHHEILKIIKGEKRGYRGY